MEKVNILILDTSSAQLKVGLSINDKRYYIDLDTGLMHIENLLTSIDKCFEKLKEDKNELNIIGVCTGPGSFTGLRIGIATALGISYASGLECFGFSVFDVYQYLLKEEKDSIIIPIIDAKKGRYYCSFIKHSSTFKMYDIELKRIVQKIKKIKINKNIIFAGKDFSIIKNEIISNNIEFKEKYPDNYNAEDLIKYAGFLLSSDKKLNSPKPIYLRKSEAEISLLKHKKGNINL